MTTYKFHKYADLYPLASEEELSRLTEDIKKYGLANPIILIDGEILDGRNRYFACQRAKVEPHFQNWSGVCSPDDYERVTGDENDSYIETALLRWVISQNSHRRHLSTSQLAMVAAKVAKIFEEDAKKRQLAGKADPVAILQQGRSSEQAAKVVGGVSERTVCDAIKVQKESPKLAAKVSAGEITVNAAKKQLSPKSPKPIPPSIAPEYTPETLEGEKALSDFLKNLQAITKRLTPLTSVLKKKEKFMLKTTEEHDLICQISWELRDIHSAAYVDSQSTFYKRAYLSSRIKRR